MSGCFVRVRLLPAVPRACRALLFSNCIKQAGYPATNARTRNKQSWAASCCLGENQQRLLHAASTAGGGVEVGMLSSGAGLICFVGGSSASSAVYLCPLACCTLPLCSSGLIRAESVASPRARVPAFCTLTMCTPVSPTAVRAFGGGRLRLIYALLCIYLLSYLSSSLPPQHRQPLRVHASVIAVLRRQCFRTDRTREMSTFSATIAFSENVVVARSDDSVTHLKIRGPPKSAVREGCNPCSRPMRFACAGLSLGDGHQDAGVFLRYLPVAENISTAHSVEGSFTCEGEFVSTFSGKECYRMYILRSLLSYLLLFLSSGKDC